MTKREISFQIVNARHDFENADQLDIDTLKSRVLEETELVEIYTLKQLIELRDETFRSKCVR